MRKIKNTLWLLESDLDSHPSDTPICSVSWKFFPKKVREACLKATTVILLYKQGFRIYKSPHLQTHEIEPENSKPFPTEFKTLLNPTVNEYVHTGFVTAINNKNYGKTTEQLSLAIWGLKNIEKPNKEIKISEDYNELTTYLESVVRRAKRNPKIKDILIKNNLYPFEKKRRIRKIEDIGLKNWNTLLKDKAILWNHRAHYYQSTTIIDHVNFTLRNQKIEIKFLIDNAGFNIHIPLHSESQRESTQIFNQVSPYIDEDFKNEYSINPVKYHNMLLQNYYDLTISLIKFAEFLEKHTETISHKSVREKKERIPQLKNWVEYLPQIGMKLTGDTDHPVKDIFINDAGEIRYKSGKHTPSIYSAKILPNINPTTL
jgi:hypothetical protein